MRFLPKHSNGACYQVRIQELLLLHREERCLTPSADCRSCQPSGWDRSRGRSKEDQVQTLNFLGAVAGWLSSRPSLLATRLGRDRARVPQEGRSPGPRS